jgi:uncharacterized membrane protein
MFSSELREAMSSSIRLGAIRASLIAAAYAALTFATAHVAYTPLQLRASEILMPLPYNRRFGKDAVIGLTIGAFIANLISPYGIFDVVLGSLANLVAGLLAYAAGLLWPGRRLGRLVAATSTVAAVTFFIGFILFHLIYEVPLAEALGYLAASEALTAGFGGYLLLEALDRRMPRP